MRRTRVDGAKNEQDFETAVSRAAAPAYLMRLYLPQVGLANVQNLADYVLFSKSAVVVELKETKADSFSLNTFQQKEEAEKFKKVFAAISQANGVIPSYRLVIVVHFIARRVYSLYFLDVNDFKVLHIGDKDVISFDTISEVVDYLLTL